MPNAEEYFVEPTGTGEIYTPMTDSGQTIVHTSLILFVGGDGGGKGITYWDAFMRFEPTMPDDAIFDYVQLRLSSWASGGVGARSVRYGMLKRDGDWDQGTNGVADWIIDTDVPLADIGLNGDDRQEDLTVYWNDLPANSSGTPHIPQETSSGVKQYFDDALPGVVLPNTSTLAFPGLLAHLQSYWDNAGNIATRGDGNTTDGVPILIDIHTALGPFGNSESSQSWYSSRFGGSTNFPKLFLGWHNKEGASEVATACTLDAEGTVLSGLSAEIAVAATLDAAGALSTLAGKSEIVTAATLDAAASLTIAGKSELDVVALLDNLPSLVIGGSSELSAVATMDGALTGNPLHGRTEMLTDATLDADAFLLRSLASELSTTTTLDAAPRLTIAGKIELAVTAVLDLAPVVFRIGPIIHLLQRVASSIIVSRTATTAKVARVVSARTVSIPSSTAKVSRGSATLTLARTSTTVKIPEESS